jgi:hypothetical protein
MASIRRAKIFNSQIVFESWDMLSGRLMPELGGSPRHLDIVGINYYFNNQWLLDEDKPLADDDPRRMPLRNIVSSVWQRYGREIILTETSHIGEARPSWIHTLIEETAAIKQAQIPLAGICWYPVLEMGEWHNHEGWTPMGLWDLDHRGGSFRRIAYEPALRALEAAQTYFEFNDQRLRRHLACG